MQSIYADTNVLIYFSQPHCEFFDQAKSLFTYAKLNDRQIITSSLGIGEFLSKTGPDTDVEGILSLVAKNEIREQPFDHDCALLFGQLRAQLKKSVHPMDVTHMAVALRNKAELFATNDLNLCKIKINKLKIIPLSEFTSI